MSSIEPAVLISHSDSTPTALHATLLGILPACLLSLSSVLKDQLSRYAVLSTMHPYPHFFLHRGPSRIFWFILGAGAASWWHHYRPCTTMNPHHRVQAPQEWHAGPTHQRDWEQDRERFRHLQQRAGETVADLSESTLDSIISGAESLKARLTQLRTERERMEAEKKAPQSA